MINDTFYEIDIIFLNCFCLISLLDIPKYENVAHL